MKVPVRSYSGKYIRAANKPSIEQYFSDITSSKEAAINFITNNMAVYTRARGYKPSQSYAKALSSVASNVNEKTLSPKSNYSYAAFINAIAKFDMTKKNLHHLWGLSQTKTGVQEISSINILRDAEKVFAEITASEKMVKNFMVTLAHYPNKPKLSRERQIYQFTYSKWFRDNTNAVGIMSTPKLKPASVDWSSFVHACNKKFNYTSRDLTRFFREAE